MLRVFVLYLQLHEEVEERAYGLKVDVDQFVGDPESEPCLADLKNGRDLERERLCDRATLAVTAFVLPSRLGCCVRTRRAGASGGCCSGGAVKFCLVTDLTGSVICVRVGYAVARCGSACAILTRKR